MAKSKKAFNAVAAPAAKKIPHEIVQHGETRVDPYHWIRGEGDNWQEVLKDPAALAPEIRAHLEAENAYTAGQLKAVEQLTKDIGDEFVSRIIPDEAGLPSKRGDYEYWGEYVTGGDYPVYMRKHKDAAKPEVYFDGNKEGKAHKFFDIGGLSVSPDHKYLAYGIDTVGSESYNIRIRELATGKEFPAVIGKTGGGCVWSADSSTIYYTERDEAHRSKKIKSHKLGTDTAQDKEIYHEADDTYSVGVSKTRSGKYIMINSSASETNEIRFFDAATAEATPADLKLISPRQKGTEYSVSHHGDDFYFLTNRDGATEFKIMTAPVDACAPENWVDYYTAGKDVTVEGLVTLKDHMIRTERVNALQRVVVSDYKGHEFTVDFPDQAYVIGTDTGYEFDTHKMRVSYRSLANPGVTYEVDLNTGKKTVLRERKLPNGHDPSEYVVERLNVTAQDGAQIPVTLVRHKSVKADGTAPLYQYGYGSYGINMDPGFRGSAISIADRGVVYAIAHIRGGADKGQAWYLDGKKLNKKNTFTDFIDVTKALIKKGYGKEGEVVIEGGSAGGMLMGAVVNMEPGLYGAVNAQVAFVDVLNTISDGTLPLTPGEWEEWGDPIRNKEFYDYMKSYSPYDNIQKGVKYPLIIAPAGLTDPRVTYWEMTKWIARLRDEAKGGPFLLKMNMGSGHSGITARYDSAREPADEYAICLQTLIDKGHDLSLRVDYKAKQKPKASVVKKKGGAPKAG